MVKPTLKNQLGRIPTWTPQQPKWRLALQLSKLMLAYFIGSAIFATPLFGQTFRNASDFQTEFADDKLIDEPLLSLPSNELLLYHNTSQPNQSSAREDACRVIDFLRIPSDANASEQTRNGYFFTETAPSGSNNLPSRSETFATLFDYNGDGKDELVRAVEDDNGEIVCFLYADALAVGSTQIDNNPNGASQLIHRVPAPTNGYLPITDGVPSVKLHKVSLENEERDHLLISYLRRLDDTLYQLNLDLWQDGLVTNHQIDIPFVMVNNLGKIAPLYDIAIADFDLDGESEIAVLYELIANVFSNNSANQESFAAFMEQQLLILRYDQQELIPVYEKPVDRTNVIVNNCLQKTANIPSRAIQYIGIKMAPQLLAKDINGDRVPELFAISAGDYLNKRETSLSPGFVNSAYEQEFFLKGDIFQIWEDSLQPGIDFFDTLQRVGSIEILNEINEGEGSLLVNDLDLFYADIQLAANAVLADLDGDGAMELVYGMTDYHISPTERYIGNSVLGVIELNLSNPASIHATQTQVIMDVNMLMDASPIPQNPIAVSDLETDGTSEIIHYKRVIGETEFKLNILNYSGPSNNLNLVGSHDIDPDLINNAYSVQILTNDIDGAGLPKGRYMYLLHAGNQYQSGRLVLN